MFHIKHNLNYFAILMVLLGVGLSIINVIIFLTSHNDASLSKAKANELIQEEVPGNPYGENPLKSILQEIE